VSASANTVYYTLWAVHFVTHHSTIDPSPDGVECIEYRFPVWTASKDEIEWFAHDLTQRYMHLGWNFISAPNGAPAPESGGPYGQIPECSSVHGATCATRRR
jgi:hypothetical protein